MNAMHVLSIALKDTVLDRRRGHPERRIRVPSAIGACSLDPCENESAGEQ